MKPALTTERLQRAVQEAAELFEVPIRAITGRGRRPAVTRARLAVYAALYAACETSYTDMAERLDRDHSTLIYGVRKAHEMADADPEYQTRLERLTAATAGSDAP